MTAPQTIGTYKLPLIIWESLEPSLFAESRNCVRTIADILKVDKQELLKAVLPDREKSLVSLFQTEDIRECKAWLSHPSRPDFAIRCRKPTFPGDECCAVHKHNRASIQPRLETPLVWKRIKTPADLPPLWLDEHDNVVNIDGLICGKKLSDTNQLIFYDLAPSS